MKPNQFRATRQKLGLTQEELARHFRVHQSQISRWESGKHPVPKRTSRIFRAMSRPKERVIVQVRLADAQEEARGALEADGWQPVTDIPDHNINAVMVLIAGRLPTVRRWLHSQRIRSGQTKARRKGKHIGRPKKRFDQSTAHQMREAGLKWADIAILVDVPESTLRRRLNGTSSGRVWQEARLWRF